MANCTDNDKRWSHGQPFTIILDLRDGLYPVDSFRDVEVLYHAEASDGTTHVAVWRLVKAIKHSPENGYLTAVVQAVDPLLSASGHGLEPIGPAKRSRPPFISDTVSGPVATFDSTGSSSSSSANMLAGKGKRAIAGTSSSSGSSISSATTLTTVRVQFSFVGGKEPVKV
jgi:hypothetical protein